MQYVLKCNVESVASTNTNSRNMNEMYSMLYWNWDGGGKQKFPLIYMKDISSE